LVWATLSERREYGIRMGKNANEEVSVKKMEMMKLTVPPSWLRSIVVHCMRKHFPLSELVVFSLPS